MRLFVLALFALLLAGLSVPTNGQYPTVAQPQYVGIPTAAFDYAAASQQTQMWCWAASIEMVLRYYGLAVTQQDIVARTYGTTPAGPPPLGANVQTITANLNNWGIDKEGKRYLVSASVTPSMIPDTLFLEELSQRRPLIVAYGPTLNAGHVVVLTAVSYTGTPAGPVIRTLVVRDPFPTPQTVATHGRIEYLNYAPPQQGGLPGSVQAVWFIRVTVAPLRGATP